MKEEAGAPPSQWKELETDDAVSQVCLDQRPSRFLMTSQVSRQYNIIITVSARINYFVRNYKLKGFDYPFGNVLSGIISVYCFFALITLFSPLYGFLADVRCGRYGVLLAAIWLAFCAFILVSVGAIITLSIGINAWDTNYAHGYVAPILFSLSAVGIVLFAVGLGFYRANVVQFGLDQLLEAPSKSLALFIHWGMWVERLGMLVIQIFLLVLLCQVKSQPNYVPLIFVPYY